MHLDLVSEQGNIQNIERLVQQFHRVVAQTDVFDIALFMEFLERGQRLLGVVGLQRKVDV